ncbi:MAG TPA: RluA family pseudouridine synthase [Elusimicrobiota bacterium]|nr:RluA family pseudouridine synthase [Elusimicrobiota bacterium]
MNRVLRVETGGSRLDAFLAKNLTGYTRVFLKGLIEGGHVSVDGEPRDADSRVAEGERVRVELPSLAPLPGTDFESWVIFEDKRLFVMNKPSGLLMHPLGSSWLTTPEAARAEPVENLAALIQVHRPAVVKAGTPRCGIVHRLDRLTSGVLVVAKDPETYAALCAAFKAREMDKTYRAIARGALAGSSRVQAPIGREPGQRRIVVTSLGKPAETGFKVLSKKKSATLVEAKPLTGRTHQIRAHLAYLGHPVAGDPEFDKRAEGVPVPPRMMLHAYQLMFEHPASGRPACFNAEPPKDFAAFWKSL